MSKRYTEDYMERLIRKINEQANEITMNNYDDIIKKAEEQINNHYDSVKDTYIKTKLKYKKSKEVKKEQVKDNIINNEKINKMTVGQDNLIEASKYTKFYGYSVKIVEHSYSDKINYVFSLDNNFFKKILNNPTNRFKHQTGQVKFQSVVFKYKPKKDREVINGELVYFKPFQIILNTENCHDFTFYHTEKNDNNQEVLKGLYILNMGKVMKKLKETFHELHLSEKAMTNMTSSTSKHLWKVQSEYTYGVEDFEDYNGLSEEQALIIMDDFDDGDLVDPLISYIL